MTMRRPWRMVLLLLAVATAFLVWLLSQPQTGTWACAQLNDRLPRMLGGEAHIGGCRFDPFHFAFAVDNVMAKTPTLQLQAKSGRVSLRSLWWDGVGLQHLALTDVDVELQLSEPVAPSTTPKACIADVLRPFSVEELSLDNGRFVLHLPNETYLELDGLSLGGKLGHSSTVLDARWRGGAVRSGAVTWPLSAGVVRGVADFDAQRAELRGAEVGADGANIQLSGVVDMLCERPQLSMQGQLNAALATILRRIPHAPAAEGQLFARVSVTGPASDPTVAAEWQATALMLEGMPLESIKGRVRLHQRVVSIDELSMQLDNGSLGVSGTVDLNKTLSTRLTIESKDASLGEALDRFGIKGAWVDFPASLKGTVQGHLLPSISLSGPISLHGGTFVLAARPYSQRPRGGADILGFSEADGRFNLSVSGSAVSFEDIVLATGPAKKTRVRGSCTLYLSQAKGLDIRVVADAVDLADFGSIVGLPWRGVGTGRANIIGPYGDIVIDGMLNFRDFHLAGYTLGVVQSPVMYVNQTLSFPRIAAQKGKTQYFGNVDLVFSEPQTYLRSAVQIPEGRVEDVVDILHDLSPAMDNVTDVLRGKLSAVAAFDSPLEAFEGQVVARLNDVSYFGRRFGQGDVTLRFIDGEQLEVEPTRFVGESGNLQFDGRWSFLGPLDFRVSLENASVGELFFSGKPNALALGGVFSTRATVQGTPDEVKVDGEVATGSFELSRSSLGAMSLRYGVRGRSLTMSGQLAPGIISDLTLDMRQEWPLRATLAINRADLGAFVPRATEMDIEAAGTLQLNGPLLNLNAFEASARFERLALGRGEVKAANSEPVVVSYSKGAYLIDSLALSGPETSFRAAGRWGPSLVELSTSGSLDLRLFSTVWRDIERLEGRLSFTAAVFGAVSKPRVAGSIDLEEARLRYAPLGLEVKSAAGHGEFSQDRVLIDNLGADVNGGRVLIDGDVTLDRLKPSDFNLRAQIDNATIEPKEDLSARLNGTVLMSRQASLPVVSGELELSQVRYVTPLTVESLLSRAKTSGPGDQDGAVELWRNDLMLVVGKNVWVDNNLARAQWGGKLKLAGNNIEPSLIGALEAKDGAQLFFRGNTYNVSRAVLQFNGLWPTFDLAAQTQVREYLVNVKAFGKIEEPKLSFFSEPSLPEADLVSLLTLGVTSRDSLSQAGVGVVAEALLSASGFEQQVQRFLKSSVGLKDQQVRLTTLFNEASGTAEPSINWESRLISDSFKLGVTQPVTGRGTKAQAEYRFTPNVSARMQWDNQNFNTSVGNPGVDFRFRFEWE
jgi:translocation and assembly module TamB